MNKTDAEDRRIAACLAVCEGEEFTIERLESGAFNLRDLVDQAFRSSQAHAVTMEKLLAMTKGRNELLVAFELASDKLSAGDASGAAEVISNAVVREKQRESEF